MGRAPHARDHRAVLRRDLGLRGSRDLRCPRSLRAPRPPGRPRALPRVSRSGGRPDRPRPGAPGHGDRRGPAEYVPPAALEPRALAAAIRRALERGRGRPPTLRLDGLERVAAAVRRLLPAPAETVAAAAAGIDP